MLLEIALAAALHAGTGITVYDDNPARGHAECAEQVAEWGGDVTCIVEPTSAAPDVNDPGFGVDALP